MQSVAPRLPCSWPRPPPSLKFTSGALVLHFRNWGGGGISGIMMGPDSWARAHSIRPPPSHLRWLGMVSPLPSRVRRCAHKARVASSECGPKAGS